MLNAYRVLRTRAEMGMVICIPEGNTGIVVGDLLTIIEYGYPAFHLSMPCFWCQIVEGTPVLREHKATKNVVLVYGESNENRHKNCF